VRRLTATSTRNPRGALVEWSRGAAGAGALAGILLAGVLLAAGAAGQRLFFFVPAEHGGTPGWLRGPLAVLDVRMDARAGAALLVVFFACYLVAVACAGQIRPSLAIGAIVALHVVFLLGPPIFSADVFSYIDFARLGAIHGLSPYTHGALAARGDSVVAFVGWHHVSSPYGPLFTLLSYAFAHLSVAVTLWIYKLLAALAGLGCVALVWRLAQRTGQAPQRAAMLVGLNPLFVVYAVGGAHNDLLVEVLVLGGISSALAVRVSERSAGGQLALAALTKASAGLVLPFLLAGTRRPVHAAGGAVAATAAVCLAAVVLLGGQVLTFVPQLFGQQQLVARLSVPNQLGVLLGQGGLTTPIRIGCLVAFAAATLRLLWRAWDGSHWVTSAGWTTLAALVTSAWLTPWYVVWLLPLAAIAPSRRLRLATLVFCGYIVATRVATRLL
jgi:alpha-1,6-mannosyltransferase